VPGRQSHEKAVRRSAQTAFFLHAPDRPLGYAPFLRPERNGDAAGRIKWLSTAAFYISEMPKYSAWYDNRDPENTRLMDAMADLRRMCCTAEHTNPHTLRPGSFAAKRDHENIARQTRLLGKDGYRLSEVGR
jgi:hypothetical protein